MKPPFFLTALAVLGVFAFMHHWFHLGRDDGRAEIQQIVERFEQVPMVIGDWRGTAMTFDQEQVKGAHIKGYLYRRYENQRTGHVVQIFLVCGRPGPISVHTPDICYRGAGYRLAKPVDFAVPFKGGAAVFKTVCMRRPEGGSLRVFWSWYANGAWSVPERPRVAFARFGALSKLYVLHERIGEDDESAPASDAGADLLALLGPAIHDVLAAEEHAPSAR